MPFLISYCRRKFCWFKLELFDCTEQDHSWSGHRQNGDAVIGASIVVKGTTRGTITNIDGEFSIDVAKNEKLVVSYIGYTSQEITPSGTDLTVVLEEDTEVLDEVVVLGYGANARKQDLSASVGVLSNTEELTTRPVSSTESMLQGQLAGVTVQANGGDPTSAPSIVIRGQGSQNGDNVLWVVDGVPGAPIASMNDIESITVLKDAASAAIYGAQSGAGGVILVTTKKAKEGAPSVSYDATFGIRQATNLPVPLNAEQEIEMRKLSYANAGFTLPQGWDVTKNPWIATTRTDWMDEISVQPCIKDTMWHSMSVQRISRTEFPLHTIMMKVPLSILSIKICLCVITVNSN